MKYYMTVDPSVRSMGVALWSARRWKSVEAPVATFLLTGSQRDEWLESAAHVARGVANLFVLWNITKVFCEMPPFIQTSAQSGAQAKLMHSAGMVAGIGAAQDVPPTFEYVDVNAWKGNLPKQVVIDRIERFYKKRGIKLGKIHKDEWDAVGIGLYLKGQF